MARDDLKKRIEMLNRQPMRHVPSDAEPPEIQGLRRKLSKRSGAGKTNSAGEGEKPPVEAVVTYSRSVPAHSNARRNRTPGTDRRLVSLADAAPGTITEAPCGPGYYLIEKRAEFIESTTEDLYAQFVSLTGHPDGEAAERIAAVCRRKHICPDEILFLDLETTGLSMTPVFLIGTMECTESGFHFRQYFARDYSEESSILAAASERLGRTRLLITFNGKSFDMPYLKQRAVATGVPLQHAQSHLDILHEARREYRGVLPDCRLQTLERHVCGRSRDDDIPGSEIPEAYHEFVRTGNADRIGVILQHNLYDLLTMADLMCRMYIRG